MSDAKGIPMVRTGCIMEGSLPQLLGRGLDMPYPSDLRWELRADGHLLGHVYVQAVKPDGQVDMVFHPLPGSAVSVNLTPADDLTDCDMDMLAVRPGVEASGGIKGAKVWCYTDVNGQMLDGFPCLRISSSGAWQGFIEGLWFLDEEGRRDQIEALIEETLRSRGYTIVDSAARVEHLGGDVDGAEG
jgi:hypothetical protein